MTTSPLYITLYRGLTQLPTYPPTPKLYNTNYNHPSPNKQSNLNNFANNTMNEAIDQLSFNSSCMAHWQNNKHIHTSTKKK